MKTIRLAALPVAAGLSLMFNAALAAPAPQAAGSDADQEASALNGAPVTLIQAITTAQTETGGRAYDAGVHVEHGHTRIVVETNGPNGVHTVAIDAQSGQVVARHAGGEPD